MPPPAVAVIDIGSNSIKILVATRTPDGRVTALATRTIDARISAGISKTAPRLSDEGMARGLEAIQSLLAGPFRSAQDALEADLDRTTIAALVANVPAPAR